MSSSVNDRPVVFIGIGPRGRSPSFFFAFWPPRDGLASGPKFRLRGGADGPPDGSKGRGPPNPPGRGPKPPGRGPNPPGRGPDDGPPGRGPPGPRSSRARASLTASGRP